MSELLSQQLNHLKVASLRFLSTLICSSTYTELLVLPKDHMQGSEHGQNMRHVLQNVMRMMTQRAVLSSPISKHYSKLTRYC